MHNITELITTIKNGNVFESNNIDYISNLLQFLFDDNCRNSLIIEECSIISKSEINNLIEIIYQFIKNEDKLDYGIIGRINKVVKQVSCF